MPINNALRGLAKEFYRAVTAASSRPSAVDLRSRSFTVIEGAYHQFWQKVRSGRWERDTFDILERFAQPDVLYVDIGAWIGPTALFAAASGANVVAFELDQSAISALKANIAKNPGLKVNLKEFGLAAEDGTVPLFGNTFGDSTSSIVKSKKVSRRAKHTLAKVRSIRDVAAENQFERACLIKIDVEGAEYEIVPELAGYLERFDRATSPAIYLSLHPQNLDDRERSARSLDLLRSLGEYDAAVSIKKGFYRISVADLFREAEKPGGLGGEFLFIRRGTSDVGG